MSLSSDSTDASASGNLVIELAAKRYSFANADGTVNHKMLARVAGVNESAFRRETTTSGSTDLGNWKTLDSCRRYAIDIDLKEFEQLPVWLSADRKVGGSICSHSRMCSAEGGQRTPWDMELRTAANPALYRRCIPVFGGASCDSPLASHHSATSIFKMVHGLDNCE
ncbi:hypothetical protein AAVH_19935 [Aphelenchoides avenae]|nr:hypothetical protein AAVH_19935 [Aphelenchus avenae]